MTEALNQTQQQYQPKSTKILFVEEAVNLKTFFLPQKLQCFRAIKEAFSQVFGEFKDHEDFLQFFKASGCYVEYLCQDLINRLKLPMRQKVRTESI